jgi:3-hydroxyacyl-[acyl-carrier-protein] dehydratase
MRLEYFQMIDRIVDIKVDERLIRSVCTVPEKSTVFEGHFPTYPLMPGVLLTECMAQTTGWLVSALCGFATMPILVGVKDAKFRTFVFPGDELEFEGKVVHEGSGYVIGSAEGRRKTKLVCEAGFTYRMVPYPSPQFRDALWEWAERINVPIKELAK